MKRFSSPLVIKSFAKLNLFLQVLSKRKDNFHNLRTLFCRINLADSIIFRDRLDGLIKIKCLNRQVPCDKTNLCWRAAQLLKKERKLNFGIDIEIKKHIPVGAGLGGGSSNAASTLLGLNKYWNLNLSQKKLAELGAKIGSDIPFFIYNAKFALGSHKGDKIKQLTLLNKVKLWFILVYPRIKVSTPLIYQKFDTCLSEGKAFSRLTRPQSSVKILTSKLLKKGAQIEQGYLFNSLEAITASIYPVINQVKKALYSIGLEKAMMSGSGAAVFAICNSQVQAKHLSNKLRKKYKAWQIFAASAV